MRRLKLCAALTAALAALNWAFTQAERAVTRLIMAVNGYDYGRAAARAPVLTGLAFGVIGICLLCAWVSWTQAGTEKRLKKIRRDHARNATPTYREDQEE